MYCINTTTINIQTQKLLMIQGKKIRRCNKIDFLEKEEEKPEKTRHKKNCQRN